ncbi:MAG TPA: nitroreductase family deazaflavin-dependent oxidoreductase [Aggregatilineales bacterium]|nr:nitroreductase family deazaflavin-dependent oxidoreductase [Aggregatilineales bacterium]
MSEFQDRNRKLIEQFRANRDKGEANRMPMPLVILTTTGAKSGKSHATPVRIFMDGDKPYVIASKGGAPSHPDWYRNLVAYPEVTVELGKETFKAKAVVASGKERDRLFKQAVAEAPGFGEYQANTTREIPVVVLERERA